jgi:hypothetical protein
LTHGDVVEEQEWKLRHEAEEEEENEKRLLVRVCCTDLKGNQEVSRQEKRERESYVDHLVIRDEDGSAADRISVISILLEVLHSDAGSWRIVALHAGSCFLALHLCWRGRISWRILSSECLSSLPL